MLGRHVGWRVVVLRRSGHRHWVHLSRSHVRGSWLGLGQSRASGRLRRVRVRHRTSGMEGRGHGTASAAVAVLLARRETHVGIVGRVLRVEASASTALRLETLTVWALVRTNRSAHIAVLGDARFSSNMRARLGGQSGLGLRSGGLSHVALQRVIVSKGTNDAWSMQVQWVTYIAIASETAKCHRARVGHTRRRAATASRRLRNRRGRVRRRGHPLMSSRDGDRSRGRLGSAVRNSG